MTSLWYSDGPGSARLSPTEVMTLAGFDRAVPVDITIGWTLEHHPWIIDPTFRARTTMAGYALSRPVDAGRISALPIRISAVPTLIRSTPPDVGVVPAVRRGDQLVHSGSLGWADVLARAAGHLVVEIDEEGVDLGAPPIEGNIVAAVPRPPAQGDPPRTGRPADEIDLAIGAAVVSLLPDEPTLEFGPGGIGEGIVRSLDRPVRIRSGLLTDDMASLHRRGLLLGPAMAAYAWGGQPIIELAAAGMLHMRSITVTNDLTEIAATPHFVACNTAVQVGLDGSVNLERVGGRTITSIGGHADFCAGASQSVGGISIIALRSTTAAGASTIVDQPEVVSTARADIDVVVTEHGIADLRGCDHAERRRRVAAIATPGTFP